MPCYLHKAFGVGSQDDGASWWRLCHPYPSCLILDYTANSLIFHPFPRYTIHFSIPSITERIPSPSPALSCVKQHRWAAFRTNLGRIPETVGDDTTIDASLFWGLFIFA